MKKKVLNGLLVGGIGLLAMSSIAAVTLTSCAQTSPTTKGSNNKEIVPPLNATQMEKATVELYNQYNRDLTEAIGNSTGYITHDKVSTVTPVMDKYKSLVDQLQTQINKSGTTDEKIWIDSVKVQLQIERLSVDTKAYLLGAPIGGDILSADPNEIVSYAEYVGYGETYDDWLSSIETFATVISAVQSNFDQGAKEGATLSGIMLKLFAQHTIKNLYANQLAKYLDNAIKTNSSTPVTAENFETALGKADYFSSYVKNIPDSKLTAEQKTTLTAKAQDADAKIDSFVKFLLTTYWQAVDFGWTPKVNGEKSSSNQDEFKIEVVNAGATGERMNSYKVSGTSPKAIKGLGITQKDLDTKDVGIGFAKGTYKDGKWKDKSIGLTIYQDYLLFKHTTLYSDAPTVINLGLDNVGIIKNNMKSVAQYLAAKLAPINVTKWEPTGYTYDDDIFDDVASKPFTTTVGLATKTNGKWVTSDEQLKDFFKWLNADQWFFGRDVAPNQVVTLPKEASGEAADLYFEPNNAGQGGRGVATVVPHIIDKTPKAQLFAEDTVVEEAPAAEPETLPQKLPATGAEYSFNMNYAPYLGSSKITKDPNTGNKFGDDGNLYEEWVVHNRNIAPGKANISGAQAYAGASFSMDSYNLLRDAVLPTVSEIFVKSKDSDVQAPSKLDLKTTIVTGTGLSAAYANGNKFYIDVNPFYGWQKWGMTTLLSHESLPGHNLQMIYAVDNTSSQYAPHLSYTAYGEGWGLFSEWLASQYGAYGEPAKVTGNDWLNSTKRMQLPNFDDNAFDAQNKQFNTVNINVKEANAHTTNGEFMNGSFETSFAGLSTTDADTLDQGYYNAMQYFGFLNARQFRAMRLVLDPAVHAGGPTITNGVISTEKNDTYGKAAVGTGWSLQDEIDFMQSNSGLGQGDISREAQRYLNYVGQATSYLSGEIVVENLFGEASAAYAAANNGALFMNYADLKSTQNNTAPFFNLILRNNDIPLKTLETYVKEYITEKIGTIPTVTPTTPAQK